MNAEIAKETATLGAFGMALIEVSEDQGAVDAEVGEDAVRKIAEYIEAPENDDATYNAFGEEFLRQQVRESAARLLALIDAEEDAECVRTGRLSCGCCACCGCSCDEDAEGGGGE